MKTVFLFLAGALLATAAGAQQQLKPAANIAAAGFSAARLARIDSFFNDAIARGYAPNAVTFIARNGQVVHHKAYGHRNIEKQIPARTDDFFRIASQTKLVTTIAVLMLYEEGKLFLDDPVSKFLPEFSDMQVLDSVDKATGRAITHKARKAVTIRHLLAHTAGIPYQHPSHKVPGGALSDLDGLTLDSLIRQVAARPLVHEPGEKFTYGYNTDIAGRVVEVISGRNLSQFFAERIFGPLGMKDCYFYLPASKAGRLVELYSKRTVNDPLTLSTSVENRTFPIAGKQTLFLGGAGLVCTAEDYAKICQLILNGGSYNNVRLLSRKTVDLMGRNQIGDNFVWDRNDKFGLGLQIITEDTRYGDQATPGSLTWGGAYCSEYTIDRQENLIMLVFTNVSPYGWYGDFVRKFRILTYGALE